MIPWFFFLLGSFFFVLTVTVATLFHLLAGRIGTDLSNGCLGLYICLVGAVLSMSCFYVVMVSG